MDVCRCFLLDTVYRTFIARSPAFPRKKGQMCGKLKAKLSWLPFILAILSIHFRFQAGRRKMFDWTSALGKSGNFWSEISYKSRCFIFFCYFLVVCAQLTVKAVAILQICVPDLFGFAFYYVKRSSQIYKRPITNYYSMPLSKIIWISPIISVSQTFLNNEKGYCATQSQHRWF